AAWAAGQAGTPLMVSPHGMLGGGALAFSPFKKRAFHAVLQQRALQAVSCFHATSQKELEDFRAFGLKGPVAVIPNGIDVPVDQRSRPATSVDHGPRMVLYLGRLHPKKGLDQLLHAWARVEHLNPDWHLCIVGPLNVAYAKVLRRLRHTLHLNRLEFRDGVYGLEKSNLLSRADLVVLPTLDENFGIVVAEALAHRTPVICTRGAPWQGLDHHGCGWWIDHGVDPLADALNAAMALPRSALDAMGAVGRDWMARDFTWAHAVSDTEAVYRWMLSGGPQPDCVTII
ncbi:MAG: glycosyltransferase, partial [Pseudomonadota bacterium]